MNITHLLRAAALMSILVAGSCSTARDDGNFMGSDGAANHPIAVEPTYQELKVQFAGGPAGMTPDDAMKFDAFLADYRAHGNGSLGISVPNGAPSRAAITYFAERAAATGISRDKILVSTHDAPGSDLRVEINYIAYTARTQACGDWSENESFTLDNRTSKNFGCSIQQNIAAMVADPRDLLGPGGLGPVDTERRAAVMDHYEKGEITQADKHTSDRATEQSAGASSVGQ